MNEKNDENKRFENLLRKADLPEPSSELKEQITAEAKKAWIQSLLEPPWQVPVRRLIVSAAAAVLIIWLANCYSDYTLVLWRSDGSKVANKRPLDFDELPELPYSPLVRHLVSAGGKPPINQASTLRSYTETMLLILDEAQRNEDSKSIPSVEGRSHLFPKQSGFNSYS